MPETPSSVYGPVTAHQLHAPYRFEHFQGGYPRDQISLLTSFPKNVSVLIKDPYSPVAEAIYNRFELTCSWSVISKVVDTYTGSLIDAAPKGTREEQVKQVVDDATVLSETIANAYSFLNKNVGKVLRVSTEEKTWNDTELYQELLQVCFGTTQFTEIEQKYSSHVVRLVLLGIVHYIRDREVLCELVEEYAQADKQVELVQQYIDNFSWLPQDPVSIEASSFGIVVVLSERDFKKTGVSNNVQGFVMSNGKVAQESVISIVTKEDLENLISHETMHGLFHRFFSHTNQTLLAHLEYNVQRATEGTYVPFPKNENDTLQTNILSLASSRFHDELAAYLSSLDEISETHRIDMGLSSFQHVFFLALANEDIIRQSSETKARTTQLILSLGQKLKIFQTRADQWVFNLERLAALPRFNTSDLGWYQLIFLTLLVPDRHPHLLSRVYQFLESDGNSIAAHPNHSKKVIHDEKAANREYLKILQAGQTEMDISVIDSTLNRALHHVDPNAYLTLLKIAETGTPAWFASELLDNIPLFILQLLDTPNRDDFIDKTIQFLSDRSENQTQELSATTLKTLKSLTNLRLLLQTSG